MDHRKAIDELVRGREFANKLRQVINGDDEAFAQDLAKNILKSFTNTLFLFHKYPTYESLESTQRDSCFISPTKSEDSQDSCKSFPTKNRRGCYKRRTTAQTWEKVSETPIDDGHQWRKYGQKEIFNAKYSRNYYRCSHKYEQSCQATKHVQRIQEEPPLYMTTYYGHHTCKDLQNREIILDSNSTNPNDTSIMLSFTPTKQEQECPFLQPSFPSPSVNKQEFIPSSSSDDYLFSPDGDSSKNNIDDIMSDFLYDSVDLDDAFQYFVGFG